MTAIKLSEALADPQAYFDTYARYDPRAGNMPYSIEFRGYGFVSNDTQDLAVRFRRAVARYKRTVLKSRKGAV